MASAVHLRLRDQPLGTVRAVLFDKDGTMSHSEPGLLTLVRRRIALCEALVDAPLRPPLRDLLERAYGLAGEGLHPAGTTAVASRQHNLISTATVLCQVGLSWPEALSHSEAVFCATDPGVEKEEPAAAAPTPGLERLLHELDTAGVLLGVISNDTCAGIQRFLRAHQLEHHFDGIWSADHLPAKPDPAAVHSFCGQLGIEPSACALIGDADSDLCMALAAGVPLALGFTAGWSTYPQLRHSHHLIGHWSELMVEAAGSEPA